MNNYEYRNSYKDHYDHQGVRLNPAILKSLPSELQQALTSSISTSSTNTTTTTTAGSVTRNQVITQDANAQLNKPTNLVNDVSQLLNYPQGL